jgi:anti-anti-sigma regulatory factor
MLRIFHRDATPESSGGVARVRLAGQVRAQWVHELRRLCDQLLDAGRALEIDMSDVSFVDTDGARLLHELSGRGARLVNCALFVSEQLKTVEQDA